MILYFLILKIEKHNIKISKRITKMGRIKRVKRMKRVRKVKEAIRKIR